MLNTTEAPKMNLRSLRKAATSPIRYALRQRKGEELEVRVQNLEDAHTKFQGISQQLIAIVSEEEYDLRDATEETEFEERYVALKTSLLRVLEKTKPLQAASSSGNQGDNNVLAQILEEQTILIQRLLKRSNENSGSDIIARILEQQGQMLERMSTHSGAPRESQVKLPTIKLPTFSGNIEDWKRYADTFKTLIHDSDLSGVQKHQYFVGSLSGPAARIIESIEISEQNYIIAWELLRKRYEDDRAIRKRHIQCLFELPRVHRESAGAI
ncbi:uncharacterized protein LOC114933935 [Nylanderia fulva]|uniref:uncharacterized protein LOC114933935 n=1 Tax=Nylanderia fulva TaxID=613905 RepID=UPI0010FBA63C|nr:uncharacterized protein LOC114933935 [Nylanderia fulva]